MKLPRILIACLVILLAGCSVLQKPVDTRVTATLTGGQKILDQIEMLEDEGVLDTVVVAESFPLEIIVTGSKKAVGCLSKGGTWLNRHQECEHISALNCAELGGKYNECASVCRHQGSDVFCIQMCVPTCTIK
ncbi:hypothetical protein M3P05_14875 [Sansalvadorimonas sp. 2012CJ34-2]|uniref:Uncharacterized protein n=1 Tax=Parendozoicomonas callyspongiae TaxID=2942213 RepID=A0ABT0PKG0_9GAMM|nr:hypothetical protein [Sansalvadorimonas sp. 2012CJ34-2]MCL6271207.1 hypothetical protein [Sansalvadorimonas sp. 2012CJ34-2]